MRVDPALWREERLVKGVMFHTKCEIDRYDCGNAVVAFTTYGESSSRWLASDGSLARVEPLSPKNLL